MNFTRFLIELQSWLWVFILFAMIAVIFAAIYKLSPIGAAITAAVAGFAGGMAFCGVFKGGEVDDD